MLEPITNLCRILSALCVLGTFYPATSFAAQFDCRNDKNIVEACQKIRGRLSIYANSNTILWPVGTKRLLGLDERDLKSQFPELYDKLIDGYTIYADFEICRYGHDEPGHMMSACIADISNATYITREDAEKIRR